MPELRPVVNSLPPRRIGRPDQRVGDLERSAVCDELSAQFAAGRLVPEELDERLSRAVEARTRSDLGQLLADLPALEPPSPATPVPAPVRTATPAWSALDVLALVALIGCLGVAGLGVLFVASAGEPGYAWVAVLCTAVAALGAASGTHLAHRSWNRYDARLRAAVSDRA